MSDKDIITLDPAKRDGKPTIRGSRITVYDVLSYVAAGMSIAEILEDFPTLNENDILASLRYMVDRDKQRRHLTQDWADALTDSHEGLSSVDLQHPASKLLASNLR